MQPTEHTKKHWTGIHTWLSFCKTGLEAQHCTLTWSSLTKVLYSCLLIRSVRSGQQPNKRNLLDKFWQCEPHKLTRSRALYTDLMLTFQSLLIRSVRSSCSPSQQLSKEISLTNYDNVSPINCQEVEHCTLNWCSQCFLLMSWHNVTLPFKFNKT